MGDLGRLTVVVGGIAETVDTEATFYSDFIAVNVVPVKRSRICVTHVPTGLAVATFSDRAEAERLAMKIAGWERSGIIDIELWRSEESGVAGQALPSECIQILDGWPGRVCGGRKGPSVAEVTTLQ